jgi:hypothetical protein
LDLIDELDRLLEQDVWRKNFPPEFQILNTSVANPGNGRDQVPKVRNSGLQIFVTGSFYIFATSNQYSLVGEVFLQTFRANFLKNDVK